MIGLLQTMRSSSLFGWLSALTLALSMACMPVWAHKGSDAYLDVQQVEQGRAESVSTSAGAGTGSSASFKLVLAVAVRDLDLLVPIDRNANGQITWGEIKVATAQVLALLNKTASLEMPAVSAGVTGTTGATGSSAPDPQDTCLLNWQADGLERRSDGVYFRAAAQARCPAGKPVNFSYGLLKDEDSTHRLLVAGRIGGQDLLSTLSPQQGRLVLSPGTTGQTGAFSETSTQNPVPSNRLSALRDYFALGMHHLLQGYDHLAFLLALVLPLQLSLRRMPIAPPALPGWAGSGPRHAGRSNWMALLRTVTAFTIGHSITLILATFGVTQASPAWVEPVIAMSIAVTAWLNLRPVGWIRMDVLALLFGMIHGFGFAGLLLEAAAPSGLLPWALAGFNLGVEAGQLLAVAGWVLVSQALVGRPWYGPVVVKGGSVLLILLAAWWFWQRVG